MHSSHYDSMTVHHDGDADGCMYLADDSQVSIVTTVKDLEDALANAPAGEHITLTGPDHEVHDRHEVTAPSYDKISPGPWTMANVTVERHDLESFITDCKIQHLTDVLQELDEAAPSEELRKALDAAIASVLPFVTE